MSAKKTHAEEVVPETEQLQQLATSPRKRRRRAPASGAADDCFACQDRQSKCDRRRPYCSPCLELGKDCSGYKTALTWGVGVASRGKLRGLALPIAKSKRAASTMDADSEMSTDAPKKLAKLGPTRRASESLDDPARRVVTASTVRSHGVPTNYNFINMDPSSASSTTSPMQAPPRFDCSPLEVIPRTKDGLPAVKRQRRHTLQPLQVHALHPARDYGTMPMTASIVGGYGHHDFGLSSQISPMVPSFSGYSLLSPTYKDLSSQPMVQSPTGTTFFADHGVGWSHDGVSSSMNGEHANEDYNQPDLFFPDMKTSNHIVDNAMPTGQNFEHQDLAYSTKPEAIAPLNAEHGHLASPNHSTALIADDVGDHSPLTIPRLLPSLSIGNTPKLQFLIDYYDKVISPVIVAFDGPTNPYRSHILSLAIESETLQHAIAALSASNLRIRRGQTSLSNPRSIQNAVPSSHEHSVRKSSIAHTLMDDGMDSLPQTSINEPSNEELFHKSASIKALNEQLADPLRRKDDSILATLLILCLYHICDTGVAKFKTQFAGVKKILALRGGTRGDNSKATNWLTIMFTWFDAMTASVNDREGLFDGDELDFSGLDDQAWGLENLAGCDGRLFKIISKLGRLNLLSQNKPVSDISSPRSSSPVAKQLPGPGREGQDYYSMNHNRFDGNGWFPLPDEESAQDDKAHFWREWSDIRKSLQDWHLNGIMTPPPEGDQRDIFHISESFRYSALLYTERLGYPHLPSAHQNFQSLVTQALFHISKVESDVFLLWPLFITGTECVSEQGRYLIRERCLDIQKDSGFFNNISGLELLEKIWRDDEAKDERSHGLDTDATTPCEYSTAGSHGFKWRKAMERVDGEYILV